MAKDKPYYPHNPIGSVDSLTKTLGCAPKILRDLTRDTSNSYTCFSISTKKGKEREVYEPKYELKKLQKKINSRIFEKVIYPTYLQGGIKDKASPRDYIQNSKIHAGSKFLISVDLSDFYHSIQADSVTSIFKNFFQFPDDVSEILKSAVTLNDKVPQGACTSSYIANLVFFNSEYSLVSKLRSRGFNYSRLLDDITISSEKIIEHKKVTEIINSVVSLATKHSLNLNSKKTKVERADDLNADYAVTGVWVGHGLPKLRKSDRRYIRQLVFICEKEFQKSNSSEDYHALWNRVSGQVSKLARLNHPQAKALRSKMSRILPIYDDTMKAKIIFEANKLLKKPVASHSRVGVLDSYRRIVHSLGILSRTDRTTARAYRKQLKHRFQNAPKKQDAWE